MHRRHVFGVLAVASLVVLAGCFGGSGGTPTATESDPGSNVPATFAPWISNDNLSNVTALLNAHQAGLLAEGFEGQLQTHELTTRYVVAPNRSNYAIKPVNGSTLAVWANETRAFVRQGVPGDRVYSTYPASQFSADQLTKSSRLRHFLTITAYRATGVSDCDGRQCTTFRANGTAISDYRNFTATVRVDGSGVIREFEASYQQVTDDGTTSERYHFEVTSIGDVSVERPGWVEEARAQTK